MWYYDTKLLCAYIQHPKENYKPKTVIIDMDSIEFDGGKVKAHLNCNRGLG